MADSNVLAKLERMQSSIRPLGRVAVAFSGGVDSAFVLRVAADTLGIENVLAVTALSPSVSTREQDDARAVADQVGVGHLIIQTREFENPNYLANPVNRCYFCKTELYERMTPLLAERGLTAILNGTNADDLGDFRPGLTAAAEHSVHSPCADAGLTKADIRVLSAQFGLPTADKPASPCLSSRVQYGEHITPEKLRRIEQAEQLLHALGFRECRVRHHDNLARIEVPAARIEDICRPETRMQIEAAFRALGYRYITLDLRGFRTGSMNEVVAFGKPQGRV